VKTCIITIAVALAAGITGFSIAVQYLPRKLLDEYNGMASDNFQTAMVLFRDNYSNKRVVLFGEKEKPESFKIDQYVFVVHPASQTTDDQVGSGFNSWLGNTAAHMNGMVVTLSSKWIEENNPAGDALLAKLVEHIPNFKVSAPGISPVAIKDLESGSPMMKSGASQWQWRMKNITINNNAQQDDAPEPLTRPGDR